MSTNQLARFREQILTGSPTFLIGTHIIPPTEREDYATIVSGLSLWGCILLDQCELTGVSQVVATCKGRIKKVRLLCVDGVIDLTPSFNYLEACYESVLDFMAGYPEFKVQEVLYALRSTNCAGSPWFGECIRALCTCILTKNGEFGDPVWVAKQILQATSFLRKMEVNRPDLEEEAFSDFLRFQEVTRRETQPRLDDPWTRVLLADLNKLAREHLSAFSLAPVSPKHGPGAVATPSVKCWYDKYLQMAHDDRIQFLLRVHGFGSMSDYNPFITDHKSTRTSRFCAVPKTWKKLRGIAAEPIELQFFQQAVFRSIDTLFRQDPWWRARVDLHSQEISQKLALDGSSSGRFATIDLSSASDSVTLEVVRRVFKGTPLLKWLLGTRSVSCQVGNTTVPLETFASMGSACCFPVECIIFTLAAQAASDRTPGRLHNKRRTVRVFGDDIVVQTETVPELLRILGALGFCVNSQKSYWTGKFREACGTIAFCGVDIRPMRYCRMNLMPNHRSFQHDSLCSMLACANMLQDRCYHGTRRDLLDFVLKGHIKFKDMRVPASEAIVFSFSGENGTVASFTPTNFNLRSRWSQSLQRSEVRSVSWKRKSLPVTSVSEMSEIGSTLLYVEWLITHQGDDRDSGGGDDSVLVREGFDSLVGRLPIGYTMIPSRNWVGRPSDSL